MSELLESYKALMPAKCLACPAFLVHLKAAESGELRANMIVSDMLALPSDGPFDNADSNRQWRHEYSFLLSIATQAELKATSGIARLAEHGSDCPTPKRGGVPNETFLSSLISWIQNERVCQNPGLAEIMSME